MAGPPVSGCCQSRFCRWGGDATLESFLVEGFALLPDETAALQSLGPQLVSSKGAGSGDLRSQVASKRLKSLEEKCRIQASLAVQAAQIGPKRTALRGAADVGSCRAGERPGQEPWS